MAAKYDIELTVKTRCIAKDEREATDTILSSFRHGLLSDTTSDKISVKVMKKEDIESPEQLTERERLEAKDGRISAILTFIVLVIGLSSCFLIANTGWPTPTCVAMMLSVLVALWAAINIFYDFYDRKRKDT